jgi:hypothetical protein
MQLADVAWHEVETMTIRTAGTKLAFFLKRTHSIPMKPALKILLQMLKHG